MKIGFGSSVPNIIKEVKNASPRIEKEITSIASDIKETENKSAGILDSLKNIFKKKEVAVEEKVKYADTFIKKTPDDLLADLKKNINNLGSSSLAEKTTLDNMYTIKMMLEKNIPVAEIDEIAKSLNKNNKHLVEGMFRALENNPSDLVKGTGEINGAKIKEIMAVHNDQNFGSILSLLNTRDAEKKTLFSFDDVIKIAKEVDTFPKTKELSYLLPHNGGDGSHLSVEKIIEELKSY